MLSARCEPLFLPNSYSLIKQMLERYLSYEKILLHFRISPDRNGAKVCVSRILPVLTSLEHDLKLRTVLIPPEEVFRDCPPLLSPLYRLAEPPDVRKNSSTEDFISAVSEMRDVRTCL